jgi:hypothetical protein
MWATLAVNTRLPYIIPPLTLEPTRDIRIRNKIGPAHSWGGGGGVGGAQSHFLPLLSPSLFMYTSSSSHHLLALCTVYLQCSGSMTFGVDPDPDPDPAIFLIDLQDANKNQI